MTIHYASPTDIFPFMQCFEIQTKMALDKAGLFECPMQLTAQVAMKGNKGLLFSGGKK